MNLGFNLSIMPFIYYFIAFAFNAQTFAIAILVFFFFFSFSSLFWTECKKLFSQGFMIGYQESVWRRSDSFFGRTEKSFQKNCSWHCYSRRVWHMIRLMHGSKHSHRLRFSRFLNLSGNLGNAKEKATQKTCFSCEKKHLAPRIYLAKFC